METNQPLQKIHKAALEDERIGPTHISLYLALLHRCGVLRGQNPFTVKRTEVMKVAKIRARHTYYKCLRDLHGFGYIKYYPSYHSLEGSRVFIYARKRKR